MSEPDGISGNGAGFSELEVRRGLRTSIAASAVGVMHYRLLVPTHWLVVGLLTLLGVSRPSLAVVAAALPLARFVEIIAAYAMQRTGRRKEVFAYALVLARLLWVPMTLAYFIRGEFVAWRTPAIFAVLLLSSILTWLGSNAWLSWMGDLIPSNIRGRYFGVRQVFETVMELVAGFLVAWYLGKDPAYPQYLKVVCVLVVLGVLDIVIFRLWVPHPILEPTRKSGQLLDLVKIPLQDRQYRRLVVFLGVWMFSSGLFGPYLWVFINDRSYLGLNLMFSFFVTAVAGLFRGGAAYFWGHMGDRWSARRVLALCVLVSVTPPFYYLFATSEVTWPIYLGWTVGSVAWGGIFVFTFQYGISMAPVKERSIYLAFQSAVLGLVTAASYFASGAIVKLMQGMEPVHVGGYVWTDLQLLFCLAGIGRLLSLIPLSRMGDAHRS